MLIIMYRLIIWYLTIINKIQDGAVVIQDGGAQIQHGGAHMQDGGVQIQDGGNLKYLTYIFVYF